LGCLRIKGMAVLWAGRFGRSRSGRDAHRALMISLLTFPGGGIGLPLVLSAHAASAPNRAA
jgi:hypothetical protein